MSSWNISKYLELREHPVCQNVCNEAKAVVWEKPRAFDAGAQAEEPNMLPLELKKDIARWKTDKTQQQQHPQKKKASEIDFKNKDIKVGAKCGGEGLWSRCSGGKSKQVSVGEFKTSLVSIALFQTSQG